MPVYWLLISAAAYWALWQFMTARFEWERPSMASPAPVTAPKQGLEHQIAGPDAAFDAGGGELVEIEAVAQHLQKARLLRLHVEIGGGYFERHGIGRLAQLGRQVAADQHEHVVETAVGAQNLAAFSAVLTRFSWSKSAKIGRVDTIWPMRAISASVMVRSTADMVTIT